jgi:hypothetical protein
MSGINVYHHCHPVKLEINQILKRLRDYSESTAPIDNIVTAMNQTKGAVQNRIFNSEDGSKDSQGKGLGKYSNSYAGVRRESGRQANKVDLEFTGSLRRNLQVVQSDNKVTLAIVSNSERQKAQYIENRYGKKGNSEIFTISKEESEEFYGTLNLLFKQDINFILTGEFK